MDTCYQVETYRLEVLWKEVRTRDPDWPIGRLLRAEVLKIV